jgi:hypothetical protein
MYVHVGLSHNAGDSRLAMSERSSLGYLCICTGACAPENQLERREARVCSKTLTLQGHLMHLMLHLTSGKSGPLPWMRGAMSRPVGGIGLSCNWGTAVVVTAYSVQSTNNPSNSHGEQCSLALFGFVCCPRTPSLGRDLISESGALAAMRLFFLRPRRPSPAVWKDGVLVRNEASQTRAFNPLSPLSAVWCLRFVCSASSPAAIAVVFSPENSATHELRWTKTSASSVLLDHCFCRGIC